MLGCIAENGQGVYLEEPGSWVQYGNLSIVGQQSNGIVGETYSLFSSSLLTLNRAFSRCWTVGTDSVDPTW